MDILPYNFRTCYLVGIWNEDNNSCASLRLLYRITVICLIVQFTLSELIELLTMKGSLDEVTEVLFMAFTYVALCLKILNFVFRKRDMLRLLRDFRLPVFQVQSPAEKAIAGDYDGEAALMYLAYMCLALTTGVALIFAPLLTTAVSGNPDDLRLPFRSYQPWNTTESVNFTVTYVLQFFSLFYGIVLNVTMDSMVYGFLIMATKQFELNSHRISESTMSLRRCVEHHILLQDTVYKIQQFFLPAVVPLFFFSLITLCTSIFRMSQVLFAHSLKMTIASFEFLSLALYLSCMLYQVFFYCWFGNELQLKNTHTVDAIYFSNWSDVCITERKNLVFVMLLAKNSTSISFHGQCCWVLDTFLWIAKTSYGSFNLLSRVSH